jgi:hypothetical protein
MQSYTQPQRQRAKDFYDAGRCLMRAVSRRAMRLMTSNVRSNYQHLDERGRRRDR